MNAFWAFLVGVLLRLGIPVGVTALVILLLRQLDRRWQQENMALPTVQPQTPCWQIKNCAAERRQDCPAAQSNIPCWQVHRACHHGLLPQECLNCDVFRMAPALVAS